VEELQWPASVRVQELLCSLLSEIGSLIKEIELLVNEYFSRVDPVYESRMLAF